MIGKEVTKPASNDQEENANSSDKNEVSVVAAKQTNQKGNFLLIWKKVGAKCIFYFFILHYFN